MITVDVNDIEVLCNWITIVSELQWTWYLDTNFNSVISIVICLQWSELWVSHLLYFLHVAQRNQLCSVTLLHRLLIKLIKSKLGPSQGEL